MGKMKEIRRIVLLLNPSRVYNRGLLGGVDTVIDHVSISRRVLEKRFRRTLGKSIHHEIRRARVELIVKMLTETHMRIADIAHAMDFETVSHLSRYFKNEKGVSPLQFRQQHMG